MNRHNVDNLFWLRALRTFCPQHLLESVQGDLLEQFEDDVAQVGMQRAKRKLAWNVIRFFRPGIILRNKFTYHNITFIMFENYVRVAFRNILKRKAYSVINAFGLSIGIAFCLLIYLYVADELSFDQFHANKDRIFRVEHRAYHFWNTQAQEQDRYNYSAKMPLGFQQVIKEELPGIEYVTRFKESSLVFKYDEKVFREDLAWVDKDFFKMFSFDLVAGDINSLFKNTNEVVMTSAAAKKYFGEEDPIGKTVSLDLSGEQLFTVTGIVQSPPENSSLYFNILVNHKATPHHDQEVNNWGNFTSPTFIQTDAGADLSTLEANMNEVIEKYMGSQLADWRKEGKVPEHIKLFEFNLTPLAQWHFRKEIAWHKISDPKYSFILGGGAVLILLIAIINYISLSLTTSASRRKEVGIRKVTGAVNTQLIYQFTFESICLTTFSFCIGVGLLTLFLPAFNEFTGKAITLGLNNILEITGMSLLVIIVVGVLSGSYPAFVVSRWRPAQALKNQTTARFQAGFTKPLVVLQFALSAFLLISSTIMLRQMKFIATKDLGYSRDQIVVIPTQAGWSKASELVVEQFRRKVLQYPEILSVAGASSSFNRGFSQTGFNVNGENKAAYSYTVDPYYVPTLQLEIIQGRNFDVNIASDSNAVIVNEALVREMGWTDPLQEHLNWQQSTDGVGAKVIGVVKDYHNLSLTSKIAPLLLSMDTRSRHLVNILVKFDAASTGEALKIISKNWKELYPDKTYEYSFLDEDVARQYESQKRWLSIVELSTGFAVLISCLGLFGLAGVNAVNRTKEVGIRKILGAKLSSIFVLLNRQFFWLAIIAFFIAIPFSWYTMNQWLQTFHYRIEMSWDIFIVSMMIGMTVALLTISYHSYRAAIANPADTLKHE